MNVRARHRRFPVRIELTALVDVVLLLLIFFMVSARFVPELAFELELPSAGTASEVESGSAEIRIVVDADDRYFVSGEAVTFAYLATRLSETEEAVTVVLEADKSASHGAVVRVLDAAKTAGLDSVRIAAELPAQLSNT